MFAKALLIMGRGHALSTGVVSSSDLPVFQLSVFVQLCARRERGATFRALRALCLLVGLPPVVR
jgi:hypothetical protein